MNKLSIEKLEIGESAGANLEIQLNESGATTSLSPVQFGQFLDKCKLCEKLIDRAKDEARRILSDNPEAIPGWHLAPGRTTETVKDAAELHRRFVSRGGNTEQFMRALKVIKKELTVLVREVTGQKGKALDVILHDLLSGITESKTGEPVLERE